MNLSILKKQSFAKVISLILLLLCTQLSLAGHTHLNDITYEACSICLIAEQAELDDVIPSSIKTAIFLVAESYEFTQTLFSIVSDKRLQVFYLRGPPA